MKQVNRIFIILLWIEKTNLELRLNQGFEEASALPDFTIRILTNHLGPIRKMSVVFSEHFLEETRIIRAVNVPVIVNTEEAPLLQGLDIREPCQVVLVMENPLNVSRYLNGSLWTSDTVFMLILKDPSVNLLEVFKIFHAANVMNVFVFMGEPQSVSVYTYTPFPYSRCDDIEVRVVNTEVEGFSLKNELGDHHGCLLNASAVDLPPVAIFPSAQSKNGTLEIEGIEAAIVKEVARKFNFVVRFAVAKDGGAWGWIYPQPNGVVGELFRKKSHFGFGLLATTLERYENLDMTPSVSAQRECITWAVPLGAGKSRAFWLEIFLSEFTPTTWVCIGLIFVLFSVVFWRVSKLFHNREFTHVLVYIYSSFILVPVKPPKSVPLRSLFISWVWCAFVVVISYQTLMGSKLTVPLRERDIDTIRDLLDSNLKFTGFYNTFRLISYGAEGDLKKVEKRLEPTTYGIKEAIVYIVVDRNVAYLRETTSFKYFSIINPKSKGKVHFMKECAYEYYPVMALQRRSPLTKKTSDLIVRLFETGILLKWRRHYIYNVPQPPPPVVKLSLSHMLTPFVALLAGIVIAFVAFGLELLVHLLYKRIESEVDN